MVCNLLASSCSVTLNALPNALRFIASSIQLAVG
jgi:hypothetical protein